MEIIYQLSKAQQYHNKKLIPVTKYSRITGSFPRSQKLHENGSPQRL